MSLVNKIQQEYQSDCFKLFMQHFENLLQKSREKNDVAEGNEVYKLQGEIRLLKQFLQLKSHREVKYTSHDGGYGVQ